MSACRLDTIQLDDLNKFTPVAASWKPSGLFSHSDTHVRKDRRNRRYFVKSVQLTHHALFDYSFQNGQATLSGLGFDINDVKLRTVIAEVVGQEVLRKFLPDTQPRYRIAFDYTNGFDHLYVISEKIPGFKKISSSDVLKSERFGMLIALCIFLDETDFKIGNLGENKNGDSTKIDGD